MLETDDEQERRSIAAVLELLDQPEPSSRNFFTPGHVTASAFVVHPPTARLLVHHHRRLDKWLQLGGHLEPGEMPPEAALREAEEESGLPGLTFLGGGIFDVDVHDIPAARGEPAHRHFDLRYVVIAPEASGQSMDPLESLDLAWLSFDEAEVRMPAHESLRAIRKLRQIFRGRSVDPQRG